MSAVIGYDNLLNLSGATIAASSEATGFEKENAYDWNTVDHWQATAAGTNYITIDCGSSQNCDYFACFAHDLADNSGSIRLFYSDTGTSGPWTGLFAAVSPTDTKAVFKTFTQVSKRYYKVEVQDTGTASLVGVIAFGARLDLPLNMAAPFSPPSLSHKDVITNTESEQGEFIGRSIRRLGVRFRLNLPPLITPTFAENDWQTFYAHAREKPFFFSWDSTNKPTDVAFAWIVGEFPAAYYANQDHIKLELNCEGKVS